MEWGGGERESLGTRGAVGSSAGSEWAEGYRAEARTLQNSGFPPSFPNVAQREHLPQRFLRPEIFGAPTLFLPSGSKLPSFCDPFPSPYLSIAPVPPRSPTTDQVPGPRLKRDASAPLGGGHAAPRCSGARDTRGNTFRGPALGPGAQTMSSVVARQVRSIPLPRSRRRMPGSYRSAMAVCPCGSEWVKRLRVCALLITSENSNSEYVIPSDRPVSVWQPPRVGDKAARDLPPIGNSEAVSQIRLLAAGSASPGPERESHAGSGVSPSWGWTYRGLCAHRGPAAAALDCCSCSY